MRRRRLLVLAAAALAVVVAVAVVLVVVRDDGDAERTDLQSAVALAPSDARRVVWTDWAGVRAELGLDLGAGSDEAAVEELLDAGFDADLTSASALGSSAVAMQRSFGFSPASLEWEMFAQAGSGASLVMKLGDGVRTDDVADRLRAIGYAEPAEPDGLWSSDAAVVAVTAEVTPELAFVALDAGAGLVVASDSTVGVQNVLDADADAPPPIPQGVVDTLGEPLSAVLLSGEEACGALAMANADPRDQQAGEALVAQAGAVDPLTGFAIALGAGRDAEVVMSFETAEKARTNADTRAVLAAGPAPGQGGTFAERFTVDEVRAEGTVVTIDLTPEEDAMLVSDLSSGPVLLATC
ncbi:hypothetical protein FE634_18275 [Nocardioides dongxiaopingii]|uniref:hypothetical protein n=1 Tax=Nocardioides sp. S-1144 TaxID=2582905 RepID=UPI00110EEC6D|nr:hypothetical protein [Nocardioides sp. S-1144]QCW51872.1 hypothetical protein FE634_18275 [Nocardioides sp. S-1144]